LLSPGKFYTSVRCKLGLA